METVLPSGAKVVLTVSSFQDAMALNKALMKCAKGLPMAKDILSLDVSVLKDALLEAATSEEVEAHLFKCLQRCTYDGVRVTRDLFDDPTMGQRARADYYAIAWHAIRENCSPFFDQTFSWFKARSQTAAESRKSPSA